MAESVSGSCPGCGCEPEIRAYYRETDTKNRVGYLCSCGAIVIRGIFQGWDFTTV